jgi:hypothetical protein
MLELLIVLGRRCRFYERTKSARRFATKKRLAHHNYAVVSDVDLADHVGKRVEIKGKAVEDGKGKVSIESKVKTERESQPDAKTTAKTEATSGETVPYLGVKSIKTLSSSCR